MPRDELGRLLEDLTSQLEQADALDEADRAALTHLQNRIGSALAGDGDEAEAAAPVGQADSISDLVDRFETSHPTLTMTLGRIMDVLNKLGI